MWSVHAHRGQPVGQVGFGVQSLSKTLRHQMMHCLKPFTFSLVPLVMPACFMRMYVKNKYDNFSYISGAS